MINKNRYTMARSRSIAMSDTKDTVDHFITDRFIEIILDHKKSFNNALIIGDRNNFTQKKLSEIGIKNVVTKYPNYRIYTAQKDLDLNDKGFIVPGLGDAGDRLYDT